MSKPDYSNLNITIYTVVVYVAGEKVNYDTMKEGESDEVTGSIEVQRWYHFDCRQC